MPLDSGTFESSSLFLSFCFFETGSHSVTLAGLELQCLCFPGVGTKGTCYHTWPTVSLDVYENHCLLLREVLRQAQADMSINRPIECMDLETFVHRLNMCPAVSVCFASFLTIRTSTLVLSVRGQRLFILLQAVFLLHCFMCTRKGRKTRRVAERGTSVQTI